MKIKDFLKESYIDYPEKISAVVFSPSCNFKCPACHAKHILESNEKIEEKEFFNYLDTKKGWIDGVVLGGGEPTLELDIVNFARKIKDKGFAVKLDTNGSNYSVLKELKNLVDYVAMDIKGPSYLYASITGKEYIDFRDWVEKGMNIVTQFPDYEFRTTIVPVVREGGISFMSIQESEDTAKYIIEVTGRNEHKYYLQRFVPRKNGLLDERLEKFSETPIGLMEEMKKKVIEYLPNCKIRE